MAQVRKLQDGSTILNSSKSNKYFKIGDNEYDLNYFEELIWHNINPYLDATGYDDRTRSLVKKFVNQAVEQLKSGDAQFNSDLTLSFKDNNNEWDTTPGFNKKGPKWLHWATGDKTDDGRGAPHIAMNFLQKVLVSPAMMSQKKPEMYSLVDYTGSVRRYMKRNNIDDSILDDNSVQQYNRVNLFKAGLRDVLNNGNFDFVKDSDKVKNDFKAALDLLNNTTTYNEDFFKKMSAIGFIGLDSILGETPKEPATPSYQQNTPSDTSDPDSTPEPSPEDNSVSQEDERHKASVDYRRRRKAERGSSQNSSIGQFSYNLYETYIKNDLNQAMTQFLRYNHNLSSKWETDKQLYLPSKVLASQLNLLSNDSSYYSDIVKYNLRHNIPQTTTNDKINVLSREFQYYLSGMPVGSFKNVSSRQRDDLIRLIISKAAAQRQFEIVPGTNNQYVYITTSWDRARDTYLAFNPDTHEFIVLPGVFIRGNFWDQKVANVNRYIREKGYKFPHTYQNGYDSEYILKRSIGQFIKDNNISGGVNYFSAILEGLPTKRNGGIIKAYSGAEISKMRSGNSGNKSEAGQIIEETNKEVSSREKARTEEEKLRAAKAYREQRRKQQDFKDKQSTVINSWDDLVNNLDTHDTFVVGTLISDVVGLVGSLTGGAFNPVTDVAAITSSIGTIGEIVTNDALSFGEKLGYGALGLGFNLASLIPGLGSIAKGSQIAKNAAKAIPIISRLVNIGAIGATGANALKPLKKIADGEDLTKGDLTALAYFAQALTTGGTNIRARRAYKKYTTANEGSSRTTYTVRTKAGRDVKVNEATYNNLKGRTIKDVGKDTKFKTSSGEEISVGALKTGTTKKIIGKATTHTTKGARRLKTIRELEDDGLDIPRVKINGKETYIIPKSYRNLAKKFGQKPVYTLASEEPVTESSTVRTATPEQPEPQAQGSPQGRSGNTSGGNSTNSGTQGGNGGGTSTPSPQPTPNPSPSGGTSGGSGTPSVPKIPTAEQQARAQKNIETRNQKAREILSQIESAEQDVKETVANLIRTRFKDRPGIKEIRNLISAAKELKALTGVKEIKPGMRFIKDPKNPNAPIVIKKKPDPTVKDLKSLTYMKNGKRHYQFKSGGAIQKFQKGYQFQLFQNQNFNLEWPRFKPFNEWFADYKKANLKNLTAQGGTAQGGNPKEGFFSKTGKFLSNQLKNPELWLGAAATNLWRLNNKNHRLEQKELPFLQQAPNSLPPISTPDIYGTVNQYEKQRGVNNTLINTQGVSDINSHLAGVLTSSTGANSTLTDQQNTKINTLIDKYNTYRDTKLATLQDTQRTISDENRIATIAHYNEQLDYNKKYNETQASIIADILNKKYNTALSEEQADFATGIVAAQKVFDSSDNPYTMEITKQRSALDEYRKKWEADNSGKYFEDTELYQDWNNHIKNMENYRDAKRVFLFGNIGKTRFNSANEMFDYIDNSLKGDEAWKKLQYTIPIYSKPDQNAVKAKGGSLSYEDRMNLKKQDASNKREQAWYKMIMEDHKRFAEDEKSRRKERMEAYKLYNKRSEMLLKASLQLK